MSKNNTQKQSLPEIKEIELTVHDVESDAIVVNVDGWRMRVYYEENTVITKPYIGKKVLVKYTGDIENPHSVRFQKLK